MLCCSWRSREAHAGWFPKNPRSDSSAIVTTQAAWAWLTGAASSSAASRPAAYCRTGSSTREPGQFRVEIHHQQAVGEQPLNEIRWVLGGDIEMAKHLLGGLEGVRTASEH